MSVVSLGVEVGLAHLDEGGEVQDGFDLSGPENLANRFLVVQVSADDFSADHQLLFPGREIVEDDDFMTIAEEGLDRVGADVSRPPTDAALHVFFPLIRRWAAGIPWALVSKAL